MISNRKCFSILNEVFYQAIPSVSVRPGDQQVIVRKKPFKANIATAQELPYEVALTHQAATFSHPETNRGILLHENSIYSTRYAVMECSYHQ